MIDEECPTTLKEQIVQQLKEYNSMDDDEKTKFVNSMIAKYAVLTEEMYEYELRIKTLEEQCGKEITDTEVEDFCHRHSLEFSFYSFQASFLKKVKSDRKFRKELKELLNQHKSVSDTCDQFVVVNIFSIFICNMLRSTYDIFSNNIFHFIFIFRYIFFKYFTKLINSIRISRICR